MSQEDITIRSARLADAAIFPAIERSAALLYGEIEGLSDHVDCPVIDQITHARWMANGAYLVAEWGAGRRVGYLAARPTGGGELVIHDLAVRRAFQFRGIGKALLKRALNDAVTRRIGRIWVSTDLQFPWVESLCKSTGLVAAKEEEVSPLALELAMEDPRNIDRAVWYSVSLARLTENDCRSPATPPNRMEGQI